MASSIEGAVVNQNNLNNLDAVRSPWPGSPFVPPALGSSSGVSPSLNTKNRSTTSIHHTTLTPATSSSSTLHINSNMAERPDMKAPSPSSARRRESASSSAGKKRESRAGTRKVTSLTAEQLERKRANDREAQRTIRARTKEHIESLEHQVAELSAKGDQVDRVLQRNAALEAEIAHLRQQLAIMTADDERRSSTSSNPASVISSPFNSPPVTDSLSSASSIPNHRMSMPHNAWPSYAPTTPGAGPEQAYAMADPIAAAAAAGSTMHHHHRQPGPHALAYTTAIPHSAAQYPTPDAAYHGQMYSPRAAHPQQSQSQSQQTASQQHQPGMAVAGMGYDSAFHLPQNPTQPAHAYPHPPPPSSQIQFHWDSRG